MNPQDPVMANEPQHDVRADKEAESFYTHHDPAQRSAAQNDQSRPSYRGNSVDAAVRGYAALGLTRKQDQNTFHNPAINPDTDGQGQNHLYNDFAKPTSKHGEGDSNPEY